MDAKSATIFYFVQFVDVFSIEIFRCKCH